MRKRHFRARVWLDEGEYIQFINNVEKTGLSKETYLRQLINGYQPKEMPPLEYFEIIRQMMAIGNNLNQIAAKLHSVHSFDPKTYDENYKLMMKLIVSIQSSVESPGHSVVCTIDRSPIE